MRVPGNVPFKAENRATPAPSDRWLEDSADLHPRLTGGAHFQPPYISWRHGALARKPRPWFRHHIVVPLLTFLYLPDVRQDLSRSLDALRVWERISLALQYQLDLGVRRLKRLFWLFWLFWLCCGCCSLRAGSRRCGRTSLWIACASLLGLPLPGTLRPPLCRRCWPLCPGGDSWWGPSCARWSCISFGRVEVGAPDPTAYLGRSMSCVEQKK